MIETGSFFDRLKAEVVIVFIIISLGALLPTDAAPQAKALLSPPKIRLAVPAPSLSYLPIYVALQRGFFAKRGLDVEVVQIGAGLAAPALLIEPLTTRRCPAGRRPLAREARRSRSSALRRSDFSIFSSAARKR